MIGRLVGDCPMSDARKRDPRWLAAVAMALVLVLLASRAQMAGRPDSSSQQHALHNSCVTAGPRWARTVVVSLRMAMAVCESLVAAKESLSATMPALKAALDNAGPPCPSLARRGEVTRLTCRAIPACRVWAWCQGSWRSK